MDQLLNLINTSLKDDAFITAVWSNPRLKQHPYKKVTCTEVLIQNQILCQFTSYTEKQAFHTNQSLETVASYIQEHCMIFKQVQIYTTEADYQGLINKKGQIHLKKSNPTKTKNQILTHNRSKQYLLDHERSFEFLKALGLMDTNNQVKPSKYNKYKQINKYLETIDSILPALGDEPVRIIDFGCGKSYLTFAMYHYLKERLGKEISIIGLDLKEDVIAFCTDLAQKLGYKDLHFQVGDIGHYTTQQTIDMVVSLHACNTATDAALAKAIDWKAKVILAVPCCHHECYTQIQNDLLEPILKHGILKEKIASFITDGLRGIYLESHGYKVTIAEFIDMQHTPKNILIKAIRTSHSKDNQALDTYNNLSHMLSLDLSLPHMAPHSTNRCLYDN